MQLPKRRHESLKNRDDEIEDIFLTPAAKVRLERELIDLEHVQQRQAIADVSRTVAMGDLSENAEYQEAKHRLARIHGRMFSIKDRLRRVVLIQKGKRADGRIQLGSTVVVRVNEKEKTYEIVGPAESSPSRGRISHLSPVGAALIGHTEGETVLLQTESGEVIYKILEVR